MPNNLSLAGQFQRASLLESSTTVYCKACGAFVLYDKRYNHAKFHELIGGIDDTLNRIVGENQDAIPGT